MRVHRWTVGVGCVTALAGLFGCGPRMPEGRLPPLPETGPAKPFTHPIGVPFVVLPAGWVESRISNIQLRRPILMSACEITNAQYEKFAPKHPRGDAAPGDAHPVNNVTAQEAEAFCTWLTRNDPAGRKYRLPDVVEWEYGARGGLSYKAYPWGDGIDKKRACYGAKGAEPVGSHPPNRFGLHDMAGNVAEWVRTDDIPPHALQGGGWCDNADALRILSPGRLPEKGAKLGHHGFRVICVPPAQ